MNVLPVMSYAIAILLSLFGMVLVAMAWHLGRAGRQRLWWLCRVAGWSCLLASLWLWRIAAGWDRGIAFAILAALLTALTLLSLQAWRSQCRTQREQSRSGLGLRTQRVIVRPRSTPVSELQLWPKAWVFLMAGPLSLILSVLLMVVIFTGLKLAGWSPADVTATALLVFPLLWASLAVWSTTGVALIKRTVALLALFAVSSAGVAWIVVGL